jgi:tetratricopeptide (TPR) repeat protein
MVLGIRLVLPVIGLLLGGCVYFNTYYNAQKAYDQAIRMHDKRLDKNPEDSMAVMPDEKLKLERSIAKASKVLELYPTEKKYQPKALFLIGESYLALTEYAKAILKYEELQRFYPDAKEMRIAEFHRAKCLFLNGQYPFARTALEKVIGTTKDPEVLAEALVYLAQLEVKDNSPSAALDLYERLLEDQAHTPEAKGQVRFEAAKLAFELKQWDRCRKHAKAVETKFLPTKLHYRCDMLAAECLYRLNKASDGITELEGLVKNRLYATFVPEINLKLAEGYFLIGKPDRAIALLKAVPVLAPKTAYSAEAFYRLGEYQFKILKNEKTAKVHFDSAAAAGSQFEYGAKGLERSQALARLSELRKSADTVATKIHYNDFMIAELFLFRLDNVDSALGHLEKIVKDPKQDSSHSMRAAYARAFIQEEFKHSKPTGDSLYQIVLEKYPSTDYAKQAERNLGLKPTVQTNEDLAHNVFLEAEALRFGGGNLLTSVIPAYAKVVATYPFTREAAKSQFTIAMLYEQLSQGDEKVPGSRDSAIIAYSAVRERFPNTNYFTIADAKLVAAGIKVQPKASPTANPTSGKPNPPATEPASPGSPTATPVPQTSPEQYHHGRHGSEEGMDRPAESTPVPDTTNYQPEGKTKEELDNNYENVDQY